MNSPAMPMDRILLEYAKVHLSLVAALDRISQLEAQLAAVLTPNIPPPPKYMESEQER